MPTPRFNSIDRQRMIDLYTSGLSSIKVATIFNCDKATILRTCKRAGVERRSRKEARALMLATGYRAFTKGFIDQADNIITRYNAGESSIDIAKSLNAHPAHIRRIIVQCGGTIRTGSEASKLADPTREKVALGNQKNLAKIGFGENELNAALLNRNEIPIQQLAVGSKNIDIAIAPVAVEVWFNSTSPLKDTYCRKRMEYILNRSNWWFIHIWIARHTRIFNIPAVTNEIISFLQIAKTNPPSNRQHWVIRGSGEFSTCFGDDFNKRSRIPSSVNSINNSSINNSVGW